MLHHFLGVIFDLDNTLVTCSLNFTEMKQEIGCPQDQDILTFVGTLNDEQREAAELTIFAHEMLDAQSSVWMPGAKATIDELVRLSVPLAIVTRNCRAVAEIKIKQNSIPISTVLTREDAKPKPDPEALLLIAEEWKIDTFNVAYVGDFIYDIEAAQRANMAPIWYQPDMDRQPNSALSNDSEQFLSCLQLVTQD